MVAVAKYVAGSWVCHEIWTICSGDVFRFRVFIVEDLGDVCFDRVNHPLWKCWSAVVYGHGGVLEFIDLSWANDNLHDVKDQLVNCKLY